jgi:SAM-dependent methyltransferase
MKQGSFKAQTRLFWEPISQKRWGKYISGVEEEMIRFAIEVSNEPRSSLEIGAEGGRWSKLLSDLGWQLTCTDIDSEALAICKERIPESNCVLVDPDSREFPCESASQGLLLAIEVHELVEQNWFIDEAKRVLASGGIFVGVFQNRHSWRAVLNLRSSVMGAMKHYTAGYSPWRAKLKRLGFEVLREEGICWMPFGRMSDSKLIPLAVQLEKTMGLRRLASISPWIVFAAKKV